MPSHPALETYFKPTVASRWLVSLATFFNVIEAAGLWTPAQLWVEVDNDVLVKAQILRIDVLRPQPLNVFFCVERRAAMLHAGDVKDAPLGDLAHQVVLDTELAL